MISLQKCNCCGENAIIRIGTENTPLCSLHYDIVLKGVEKLASKFGDNVNEILANLKPS